jgi:single-strand DNA-binding protein
MQKLIIAGNVGQDAVVRATQSGQSAISFTLACNEKWKDQQGQEQQKTTWYSCTIWKKPEQTSIANYIKKGVRVVIEGKPSVSIFTDQQGVSKASLDVRVNEINLMGGGEQSTAQPPQQPQQQNTPLAQSQAAAPAPTSQFNHQDDDLPF